MKAEKKIVIVGGGFGGVRCALDLLKHRRGCPELGQAKIVLISDKPYLQYFAALYRVVTGGNPLRVCIPLREIFTGRDPEVVIDRIEEVNVREKYLEGKSGSRYPYDVLVLALGSVPAYFGIPGVKERSFGMQSVSEALRLKRHLHELFLEVKREGKDQQVPTMHMVVIGGGATGVEVAGELAVYARELARRHTLTPSSLITIGLIEALPRILSTLSEEISCKVQERLRALGVNIFLNRTVVHEENDEVLLKDMEMKTDTVIWTAGVKANSLFSKISGVIVDKRGRVEVDAHLHVKGLTEVFVVGDGASTPYSGMAQTAVYDGRYVANCIAGQFRSEPLEPYKPKKPAFAIPIGPGWAAVSLGRFTFYGRLGWWLRRIADFKVFLSMLPFWKAWEIFRSGEGTVEACEICREEGDRREGMRS